MDSELADATKIEGETICEDRTDVEEILKSDINEKLEQKSNDELLQDQMPTIIDEKELDVIPTDQIHSDNINNIQSDNKLQSDDDNDNDTTPIITELDHNFLSDDNQQIYTVDHANPRASLKIVED